MSNIGKAPIFISSDVKLKKYKNFLIIFGLFGKIKLNIPIKLKITNKNNSINFTPINTLTKAEKSKWGTFRTFFYKIVYGLTNNYSFKMKLLGVGFKVFKKPTKLILRLGLSHKTFIELPFNKVNITKVNKRPLIFSFKSSNYNLLLNILNTLRNFKRPDIYKGKGFRLENENIKLKEGKKIKNN